MVDDDEDLLFCYREVLEKENTKVFTTDNVEEALEIVRVENIALVILDYVMPRVRGDQVAKRLYEINPDLVIIFLSGHNVIIDIAKELDIRICGVLIKPVEAEVLEHLAESEDTIDFILNSQEMAELNRFCNI